MEYLTLIFYKYTKIKRPKILINEIYDHCIESGLTGRIIISSEGINGSVSGTKDQCNRFTIKLRSYSFFIDIELRKSKSGAPSFANLKVKYRDQLLQFGSLEKFDPLLEAGKHINPQLFYKIMKEEVNTVILDVRNKIEHEIGKFKNAITLDIEHFREFPNKINQLKQYRNRKIVTYCTAGIRCEIATAFLKLNGFDDVYQLQGGILNYAEVTGGADFDGQCYVFDERQSIVVNEINPNQVSYCKICEKITSKIINCANPECNLLICICDECANIFNGCCGERCKVNPQKRVYTGKGYFQKNR